MLVVVSAFSAWSVAARAQNAQDKASASVLFEEGKRLLGEGKIDEACTKFEAAQRMAPTLGRKLNLADCYRRAGRTASAWAEFREAGNQAGREGDDRETFARDRAAEIEKNLSRLTIRLSPGAGVAGLEVKRDGTAVGKGLFDTGVPVDPGAHVVEAIAPGRTAWSSKVEVSSGANVTVEVPVLGEPTHYKDPVVTTRTPARAPEPPPAPPAPPRPGRSRRIFAIAVGAVGIVSLGVGGVFGLSASSKKSDALDGHCNDMFQCRDQAGVDLVKDAQSAATISTVAIGIGAAAVAAGVVLYVTAPSGETEKATAVRVTPVVGPSVFAVGVSGGF
jgi:serine/threonine-protein kinase